MKRVMASSIHLIYIAVIERNTIDRQHKQTMIYDIPMGSMRRQLIL